MSNLNFDQYQFAGGGRHPVSAEFTYGGGIVSTGIAFEDYTRMSVQQHLPSGQRRLQTPAWAVSNGKLRPVIVRYLELRAGLRKHQRGTEAERLAFAQKVIAAKDGPRLLVVATKLCKEYVALKKQSAAHA